MPREMRRANRSGLARTLVIAFSTVGGVVVGVLLLGPYGGTILLVPVVIIGGIAGAAVGSAAYGYLTHKTPDTN